MAILNLTVYPTQLMEIEESSSGPVREHLKEGVLERERRIQRADVEADAGSKHRDSQTRLTANMYRGCFFSAVLFGRDMFLWDLWIQVSMLQCPKAF